MHVARTTVDCIAALEGPAPTRPGIISLEDHQGRLGIAIVLVMGRVGIFYPPKPVGAPLG